MVKGRDIEPISSILLETIGKQTFERGSHRASDSVCSTPTGRIDGNGLTD